MRNSGSDVDVSARGLAPCRNAEPQGQRQRGPQQQNGQKLAHAHPRKQNMGHSEHGRLIRKMQAG
jgi:hypothetical protein